ncbi:MAG: TetR family transcriptional regulator C-terminal domain-containing protein [Deltaproteobacteria bacterium]|jgi:TetR/AcrR family transcriptional repressor of bet genes|nr:TetR family transcriptional regulator C-terminal domain-containing protein [Deltaproteobacteria bacterium]
MSQGQIQSAPLSRAEGKQRSRQKLITATINSIAKRGFADTTLARVAEGAGLSRGIVNFHFRSKDALFLETLKFLSREYGEHWWRAFDDAGPTAAEKLEAVLMIDFKPPISNRNRLACWFAFYGEAKSRPTYMAACTETDEVNYSAIVDLCRTIIEEGSYENLDPELVTQGLSAMSEGLWLDLLVSPNTNDPEKSQETLRTYLRSLFPKHFPIARCAHA